MSEIISIVLSFVLGTLVGGTITYRRTRRDRREGEVVSDVRASQQALAELRKACHKRRLGRRRNPSDADLGALVIDLDSSLNLTMAETVVAAGRRYATSAQAFASGDPDTGLEDEQHAYDDLAQELRRLHASQLN